MGRMCPIKSGPTYFDDVGVKNISRLRCLLCESLLWLFGRQPRAYIP